VRKKRNLQQIISYFTEVLISPLPDQEENKLMFNGVNFLQRLALQGKKKDDISRPDFVEIARVPDKLPSMFPSWSG